MVKQRINDSSGVKLAERNVLPCQRANSTVLVFRGQERSGSDNDHDNTKASECTGEKAIPRRAHPLTPDEQRNPTERTKKKDFGRGEDKEYSPRQSPGNLPKQLLGGAWIAHSVVKQPSVAAAGSRREPR